MGDNVANYAEALLPEPSVVLGRTLHSFCLGHALILHHLQSPFVSDQPSTTDHQPGLGDLLFAIEICRRPWQPALRAIGSRWFPLRLRLTALRFTWMTQPRLELELARFRLYVNRASRRPRVWHAQRSGRPPGAPWLQAVRMDLMQSGYTFAEAMNLPLGAAFWDFYAFWEAKGAVDILNETDLTLIQAAETMRRCQN